MPFVKAATVGLVSGLGVGAVFYTLGGVAAPLFVGVSAPIMGVVGFTTALALSLLADQEASNKK